MPLRIRAVLVCPTLLLAGVVPTGLRSAGNVGLFSGLSVGLFSGIDGGAWVGGACVGEGLVIVCTSQLSRTCH